MTVRAVNRTPAAIAARRPEPAKARSAVENRQRRRAGLPVTLGGGWSLAREVAVICDPLAQRVAGAPNPAAYWRFVDQVLDAVHNVLHVVVGLLAQAHAERKTRHLAIDQRGRCIRALVDMAERPKSPEITDDMLIEGTWSSVLTEHVRPFSGDLAKLLGNAATSAVSDRLVAVLREVDRAELALDRALDRAAHARADRDRRAAAVTETDRARAELESLGVTL